MKKGHIEIALFKKILDTLGPYLYDLCLFNWGEPFLHKDFFELVRCAKQFGIRVDTSTNFNIATGQTMREIIDSGLDSLTVSVDGMSRETYRKYRVGGDFAAVMQNLRKLVEEKKRRNSATPEIVFRFLLMKHNIHELEQARNMARELGCRFKSKTIRVDMLNFGEGSIGEKVELAKEWLPDESVYNRYKKREEKRIVKGKTHICKDLWQRVFISPFGGVYPCCNIWKESDFFSASFDGHFKKIWNSRKYQQARALFKGKKADLDFVCKRCYESGSHLYVS
jgi:radical SAM protein with 4Fe4S-binding SPASM domain